jgi:hypothetical protein
VKPPAVVLAVVIVACVALSGWMNRSVETFYGGADQAQRLGTVGQYFDAVSAVFSGLALLLVIGTTAMQRRELAIQRQELSKSHRELHRSTEADLRRLHMELVKMAIDDPSLAEVWGAFRGEVSPEQRRQYLYANLIFSHHFLNYKLEIVTESEMRGHLRDLVRNPIFRRYWVAAEPGRRHLVEGSIESRFDHLVDEAMTADPDEPPDDLQAA